MPERVRQLLRELGGEDTPAGGASWSDWSGTGGRGAAECGQGPRLQLHAFAEALAQGAPDPSADLVLFQAEDAQPAQVRRPREGQRPLLPDAARAQVQFRQVGEV